MKRVVSILLCVAVIAGLCACRSNEYDTLELTAMNTVMQITVFNNSETDSSEVLKEMEECIRHMDSLMNVNDKNSDISKINLASAGDIVEVDTDTARILQMALEAYEYTDGLFDIKLQPVITLWGFDNGKYGVPEADSINDALSIVAGSGYTVDLTNNTVTLTGDTRVVLGGIAKGYLGDKLLQMANEKGVSALLNLGGNIVLCGEKPDGSSWNVGIKNPLDTAGLACSFDSKGNRSVVTSGGYERYFEYGGNTYHHIIDPATGYPADSDLLSVSVIGSEGVVCDCLSTALFVAGKEKAIEFVKEFDSYEFILITEDNEILYTSGIENMKLSDDSFTLKEIQR